MNATEVRTDPGCEPGSGPGDLLLRTVAAIDAGSIPFCVLHGYETLPHEVRSDVDCLMPAAAVPGRLADVLHVHRERLDAEPVQWLEDGADYVVMAGRGVDGAPALVPLHVSREFELKGRVLFTADEVLSRVRPHGAFSVPPPDLEFAFVLSNRVVKGRLSDAHGERLLTLYRLDPEGCRRQVDRLWSKPSAGLVRGAVETGDWDGVRAKLRALRADLLARATVRRPVSTARRRIAGLARRFRRWLRPTNGLHVVFLGPDGVGKSTVIESCRGHLRAAFLRTDYFTFAPGLNPRPKPKPPGVGPHGLPPRTLPASLVKAAWWLVCYTLGYALTIHPALARSSLVINHRYLLDALVDPLRYRYNGPLGLLRFIWRVAPRPHLVILLDAPAEVVRGRKQELALEEIRRQRDAYRALVEPLACGRVVDASRPIGEVVAEVDRVILTYLAERTAGRFRLEWERLPFLRA